MNFEVILSLLTVVTGFLWGYLKWLTFKKAKHSDAKALTLSGKKHAVMDFFASLFPIFLIVLLLRSFLFEPFVIPTGSLEPTLQIGDFVLVNKYNYGLRLPVTHNKIVSIGEPKHGDIMVFRYPVDPSIYYIKRVIGLPGDTISYINKQLYVNGKLIPQRYVGPSYEYDQHGNEWPVIEKQEDFFAIKYNIFERPDVVSKNIYALKVPEKHYFVMGDNRDDSGDSRYWGFVPEENIVGKSVVIWFSWNSLAEKWRDKIRFSRIGNVIH